MRTATATSSAPAKPPSAAAPSQGKPASTTRTTARKANTKKRRDHGHAAAIRGWHTPTPGKVAPVDEHGRPKLVLQALNFHDRVELTAQSDAGGFCAEDLDKASHILREPSSGNEHPIAPRLLDILYRVQTHFGAEELRIISGYRTHRHGKVSNHGKGRALDFIVPGARDEDVAKFARAIGFVGVGIYPNSGFVHVDVRERSFFWVDASGPGRRNRTRGILAKLAQQSDADASARGERPIRAFTISSDVDALLAAEAKPPAPTDGDESDEDEDDGEVASEEN